MVFRVSRAAKEKVRELMARLSESEQARYIPSIGWASDGSEHDFRPGPVLGVHPRDKVPERYILRDDGFELAFSFTDERLESVRAKTLYFAAGQFVFL